MKIQEKYIERFWNYVEIGSDDECWNWKGGQKSDNYGNFNFFNGEKWVSKTAHHFSYVLKFGDVNNPNCVLHKCDNRLCCNPNHLWIGTRKDNNLDRDKKGRQVSSKGIKHGMCKLTNLKVMNIRIMRDCGSTLKQIADLYKISKSMVHNISSGLNWTHI